MTDRQEDKLTMLRVVLPFLADSKSTWKFVKVFQSAVSELAKTADEIDEVARAQGRTSVGVTIDKSQARVDLADISVAVVGALVAFALNKSDDKLAKRIDFTRTSFLQGRDTLAYEQGQEILNEAQKNATALADYGITADDISELESKTNIYKDLVSKPRESITSSKAATTQLKVLFQKADDLLQQLDNLSLVVGRKDKNWLNSFKNSREIIDSGHNPTTIDKNSDTNS